MIEHWQVTVDRAACIGSGMCAGLSPERFHLDAESRSVPPAGVIEADEAVRDAADMCPMEAILINVV